MSVHCFADDDHETPRAFHVVPALDQCYEPSWGGGVLTAILLVLIVLRLFCETGWS